MDTGKPLAEDFLEYDHCTNKVASPAVWFEAGKFVGREDQQIKEEERWVNGKRTTVVRYIWTRGGNAYQIIFCESEEDCLGALEDEKAKKKRQEDFLNKYR